MTVTYDRILDNARLRAPGVLDGVLRYELFMTLDDFFQQTNAWTQSIDFVTSQGKKTYSFATVIGQIVRLADIKNVDDIYFKGLLALPGEVTLLMPPNGGDALTARFILTVSDPTDRDGNPQIPDEFYLKYHGVFLDGLLGRLMSQPAKPYTSEKLSIYHMRRFRNGCAVARTEALHDNLQGGQHWRFPRFGG